MKKLVLFLFLLGVHLYGASCYSPCIDSLLQTQSTIQFTNKTNSKLAQIRKEIENANKNFQKIIDLAKQKYASYIAERAYKQDQLNTIKNINFELEKLISIEEIKARNSHIRLKKELAK